MADAETKVVVLAGMSQQAREWASRNGLSMDQYIYASSVRRIAGIGNCRVVTTGTFWERDDAVDVSAVVHGAAKCSRVTTE